MIGPIFFIPRIKKFNLQKMKVKDNKKILYLGHDPSRFFYKGDLFHFPIIETVPHLFEYKEFLKKSTHLLLTSRQTVFCLLRHVSNEDLIDKKFLTIGRGTTEALVSIFSQLNNLGVSFSDSDVLYEAATSTSEGVVTLLKTFDLKDRFVFYPHSALARPVIKNYLVESEICHFSFSLYTTRVNRREHPMDLTPYDQLVFTSPSTVHAFLELYHTFPKGKKLVARGSITQRAIDEHDRWR